MSIPPPLENYEHLAERINRFPQGAPASDSLYKLLSILLSEREAGLVARLPIKPFSLEQACRCWDMPPAEALKILDGLSDRAILLDTEKDGRQTWVLPPPMPGFFEFSLMRVREDLDEKALAEMFYQYCTTEDVFMRDLFTNQTQVGRVFVNEPLVRDAHVLDYERASDVIRTAKYRSVSMCYCRHKVSLHGGQPCNAPMDICMTFGGTAQSLVKHGYGRSVDAAEGLDLLQQAYDSNLVQFGENVRQGVSFICNCCGCCCQALSSARKFGFLDPIVTSAFLPAVEQSSCSGCGKCVNACPIEGIGLVSANDAAHPSRRLAKVYEDVCLGCGVCARVCPKKAIHLQSRKERVITPLNSTHRIILMAIERGMLQDLIFDNRVLWSQRTLAAFLGSILKLSPVKKILASQQVRSRYLEAIAKKFG